MHAFDILRDPVRRRILELLSNHDLSSGEVVDVKKGETEDDLEMLTFKGEKRAADEEPVAAAGVTDAT